MNFNTSQIHECETDIFLNLKIEDSLAVVHVEAGPHELLSEAVKIGLPQVRLGDHHLGRLGRITCL